MYPGSHFWIQMIKSMLKFSLFKKITGPDCWVAVFNYCLFWKYTEKVDIYSEVFKTFSSGGEGVGFTVSFFSKRWKGIKREMMFIWVDFDNRSYSLKSTIQCSLLSNCLQKVPADGNSTITAEKVRSVGPYIDGLALCQQQEQERARGLKEEKVRGRN